MRADSSWRPGRQQKFAAAGIDAQFVQDNHSRSKQWTLRGLHMQVGAHRRASWCASRSGSVFDVVVDLRRSSPSFGAWWGIELSAENHRMLWVPPGLAHGILVTSPSADFLYKCTDFYSPADERTLAWNDPALGIDWPLPAGAGAAAVGEGRARAELCRHREIRMRVLVLGAGGQVGQALSPGRAVRRHEVIARTRAELDIADAAAVERAMPREKPDWIVMPPPTPRWISPRTSPMRRPRSTMRAVGYSGAGRGGRLEPARAPVDGFRIRRHARTAPTGPTMRRDP